MADKVDAIIKVKRGPEADRKIVTFGDGELAYSTDIKRMFVGDGGFGGNPVGTKVHITSATPAYALSGDLLVKSNANASLLYVLTGSNYSNLSAYVLLADSNVDTVVQTNSASWGGFTGASVYTTVNSLSDAWNNTYTTVSLASALWNTGGGSGDPSFPDQFEINTLFKENSASWESTYNTVLASSALWGGLLSNATVQTYSNPLTANGKFLVFDVGGVSQAIRLWDTP
jgi:hypothetical protein